MLHRSVRPTAARAAAVVASVVLLSTLACAGGSSAPAGRVGADRGVYRPVVRAARPLTVAERSGFTATSTVADVRLFLDSLVLLGGDVARGSFGRSADGHELEYVVASRPLVRTPIEAKRLNRPIVFIQGGIHGGEVEGKEALQAILRDLVFDRAPNVLDSIVLVALPMYNPDGAERLGPQERNRAEQNGPERIGLRPNGDTLDLNRDYIKAEAPETQASLRVWNTWDPDVFIDLHTTNGSYHGYGFTYAPPLNPASIVTRGWVQDTVLPELRLRLRARHRVESFPYGNFVHQDSVERGWFTYDHRPRFGTNYTGLRGRVGILFEAYSHDPYRTRVATAYTFLHEMLGWISDNVHDVVEISREADRRATGWGTMPASAPRIPLRAALTTPHRQETVLVETLERTGDTVRTEPGLAPGLRRGRVRGVRMPIHDRFTPTLLQTMSYGYAIPPEHRAAIALLRRHGLVLEQAAQPIVVAVETFRVDSIVRAPLFQKHRTVRLEGRWFRGTDTLPAGTVLVRSGQPLSVLAMYLLEPQSDDGLATWNHFDAALAVGRRFPVVRLAAPITTPVTVIDGEGE